MMFVTVNVINICKKNTKVTFSFKTMQNSNPFYVFFAKPTSVLCTAQHTQIL